MAQEVFARIEKKFLLRPEQYKALRAVFDEKMAQDAYGRHTILNIYLDTPDYELTRESIEKPIYKETTNYGHFGKENLSWEKIDNWQKNEKST